MKRIKKKYHLKESVKGWLWVGVAALFVYALLTYQAYRVDKIENNKEIVENER